MSRFAKVNLLEVEDSVAGRVEGLEGRFGRKHLGSRDLGVSLFRYAPNLRSPMAGSGVAAQAPSTRTVLQLRETGSPAIDPVGD